MKKKHLIFNAVMVLCFFTAARASVGKAHPMPDRLMEGVLYMTVNISENDVLSPSREAMSASTVSGETMPEATTADQLSAVQEAPVVFQRTITTAPLGSEGLYISNQAKAQVDIDQLLSLPPETAGAQVLILHTHGCESYAPSPAYDYKPDTDIRTTDRNFNVVRVGDEIQHELEALGVEVIHDTTLCDDPDFNSSYSNSLKIAKKHMEENPGIKVILDVHRDSIQGENGEKVKTAGPDGASQLMFVVGTDMGGLDHPLWRQNLSFALNLQRRLVDKYPTLMRPINLRSSRFNQQVSTGSIIVEVGSDANTLDEALAAARIFGRELGGYLTGK